MTPRQYPAAWCGTVLLIVPSLLASSDQAQAQSSATVLQVEPARSLVWWQINPHYGHLWATSCPNDHSWQPGEGYSAGYHTNEKTRAKVHLTNVKDKRIPLYPRQEVNAVCRRAVRGQFEVEDATSFTGARGTITVLADSIVNGSNMRDTFTRKYIFSSSAHKEIGFQLTALSEVQPGDTLRGVANGIFTFRGVQKPIHVPFRAWQESGGLRVVGQWQMLPGDLSGTFGVRKTYLTMGVASRLWEELHMGFDLLLLNAPAGAGSD